MTDQQIMTLPYVAGIAVTIAAILTISPWWVAVIGAPFLGVTTTIAVGQVSSTVVLWGEDTAERVEVVDR